MPGYQALLCFATRSPLYIGCMHEVFFFQEKARPMPMQKVGKLHFRFLTCGLALVTKRDLDLHCLGLGNYG